MLAPPSSGCPVCGAGQRELLFAVEHAPVACGRLFSSREESVAAGECRLEITLCPACGHIWNAAHRDGPDTLYDEDYYSSKTSSSQARDYQDALAEDLHRLAGVAGKTVLEIGCGDGYFLKSLSAHGAKAIGFEPSSTFDIARTRPGIEVFHDAFRFDGTPAVESRADVVVMRHVLEHLDSPGEALGSLRTRSFGQPGPEYLFLEVPNVFQLLRDSLYFDFYNDHIHYFSHGSLCRLLGSAGWDPWARLGHTDEFLKLVSVNSSHEPRCPVASNGRDTLEDRSAIISAAMRFRRGFRQWKARLAKIVTAQRERGDRIAVWGAGSRGVALLSGLGLPADSYECVVDSDPNKHGKYLPMIHLPVCSPERLRREPVDCVLVTSYTYFDEILAKLEWFRSGGGKVIRVYPMPEVA